MFIATANSNRLPTPTKTSSSRMASSLLSPLSRTHRLLPRTMSSTFYKTALAQVPAGLSVLLLPTPPTVLSSPLPALAVSAQRRVLQSSTDVSRSMPNFPQVNGCGPPSGCCPSTTLTANGPSLERLISWRAEETTTHTPKEVTT